MRPGALAGRGHDEQGDGDAQNGVEGEGRRGPGGNRHRHPDGERLGGAGRHDEESADRHGDEDRVARIPAAADQVAQNEATCHDGGGHHGGRDLDDKREEHPGQHGGRDGLGDRGEQLAQPAGRAQDRRHHAADDVGPDDIRERVQPVG